MTEMQTFSQLEAYKAKVRALAIRVAAEQGWCDSGLNSALEELGLPPKREFMVPVEFTLTRVRSTHVLVDAQTEAEAYERVRTDPSLVQAYAPFGGEITDVKIPDPPKMPEAGSGVPVPGDPCPEEGEYYARSVAPGGPNQCRVTDERAGVYCTRPLEHTPDWHVAAGANAGVLSTWEAKDGDVRSTPAPAMPRFDFHDADEDEDGDDD